MANVNAPYGFRPAKYLSGAPYNGAANLYSVPATDGTALFVGDPVVLTGTCDTEGNPEVIRATVGTAVTTDRWVGVVVGFRPDSLYPSQMYRVASTARKVLVADDLNLLFEAQEDSVGGAMGVTATSGSCQVVAGSGNTSTGLSGFQIDSSEAGGTTATDQIFVVRPIEEVDNDPTLANARWLVKINMHCYAPGVAGY